MDNFVRTYDALFKGRTTFGLVAQIETVLDIGGKKNNKEEFLKILKNNIGEEVIWGDTWKQQMSSKMMSDVLLKILYCAYEFTNVPLDRRYPRHGQFYQEFKSQPNILTTTIDKSEIIVGVEE